jgi:xylan 1,4-beta-xylosidase
MDVPVIAGFHPDPSICRVGRDYYLANSSFEYVPGVPIWHSTNLTEWTQIGNALTRPEQFAPNPGTGSSGVLAPTLRHHEGRFYLVTTDVNRAREGHMILTADDPAGTSPAELEWSDAVHVAGAAGIDPDLTWDEEGTCHLTWASFMPGLHGIASAPVDPDTGELLGEPRLLWPGVGLAHPEGPHLYRIGDWWYLLLAEGGTERGHAVTVARSRTLDGVWEAAPRNPILSHRSTAHPVQNTGHADLVELPDGTWAMVYLGVRARGRTPQFHVNGRETFLAGVRWEAGWPVVEEDRFTVTAADHSFTEDFASAGLDPRWVSPGAGPGGFTEWEGPGRLVLAHRDDREAPALLAVRTRDRAWSAEIRVDPAQGRGRVLVRIDEHHWYGVELDGRSAAAQVRIGPVASTVASEPLPDGGPVTVRITAVEPESGHWMPADQPDLVELALVAADGEATPLAALDGRYVSTEVAGGYTGRVIGVEVLEGRVALERFAYRTDTP